MSGSKSKEDKRKERHRYYGQTAHKYPPHPWTEEEERMVLAHTIPDSELSNQLGRSVKSIQEKRRKMRRCTEAGKPIRKRAVPQPLSEEFYQAARLWKEGRIPALEGARRCGMPNSTFRLRANRLYASQEKMEQPEK